MSLSNNNKKNATAKEVHCNNQSNHHQRDSFPKGLPYLFVSSSRKSQSTTTSSDTVTSVFSIMARIRRKVANDGQASYRILIVIAMFILVLNINQTLRLEHDLLRQWPFAELLRRSSTTTTTASINTARNSALRRTPYFARPSRIYKAIPPRQPPGSRDTMHLVKPGDFIYYKSLDRWDSAPIVVESHKLIFFSIPKVGCTVWKQLFRRMMGYDDWKSQDGETLVPHNPETNGLKYLWDYSVEQASDMMTSPEWTRAIMVRDPKQRFLSAFLDKAVSNDHTHIISRCCPDQSCVEKAQTALGFLDLCGVCEDDHWRAQQDRMESKYWPYIDWVGHVEHAGPDAKELLTKIGAWEKYGQSGWGKNGDLAIFQSTDVASAGEHATWAEWQVWKWYDPVVEEAVEHFYQGDYENPLFNFTRGVCMTCED